MSGLFSYADQSRHEMAALSSPLASPLAWMSSLPSLPGSSLGQTRPALASAGSLTSVRERTEADTQLALEVSGAPSLQVLQDPVTGDLVIELRRKSQFMAWAEPCDQRAIESWGQAIFDTYQKMSQGPYTSSDLRAAGSPFGFDMLAGAPPTPQNRVARAVPRQLNGKSLGHPKGMRGSVPTLSVVNQQSGNFLRSWTWQAESDASGMVLRWRNSAKSARGFSYAWALASGTRRMQAHGPFTYAPLHFLSEINAAWSRLATRAWHRKKAEDMMLGRGFVPDIPTAMSLWSGGFA